MIDDIEALVGYIFIVGGRAVSATPPGALVELPPRRAPRAREQDTFFTLVTPAGTHYAQASLYEQLAQLAAELYFRSSGGVTNGLREAINGVNSYLLSHGPMAGQRYDANICCLVLRGNEVFLARAGEFYCLTRQAEAFITLPESFADPYNGLALGATTVVDIKLAHIEVIPGDVIILADAGFQHADRQKLDQAVSSGGIQPVLESLRPLGSSQTQAMVIAFSSLAAPDPAFFNPPANMKITRSSNAPLSKAVAVPPKAKTRTEPIITPAPASATEITAAPTARGNTEAILTVEPEAHLEPEAIQEAIQGTAITGMDSAWAEAESATASVAAVDGAAETADPQVTPDVAPAVTSPPREPLAPRLVKGTAAVLESVGKGLNRALDRMLPETDAEGPKIPSLLAAGLAMLIPVIVVFVLVAVRLSQQDTSQYEQMVRAVQEAAAQAEAISLTDVRNARVAWLGVMQRIEQVENTSGRLNDPALVQIRAKAQGILDTYAQVVRRTPTLLRVFEAGAKLVGPYIQAQSDLYTLDVTNSAIWRDRLNPNNKTVFKKDSEAAVLKGQGVSAFSVSQLIDMKWMADGSVQNAITALDKNGILVTYSPVFPPAAAKKLPGADLWVDPIGMTVWRSRLYLLDPAANQIWRYTPIGDVYPNPPDPYFDQATDLSGAVDMAIDRRGSVYILFADGTLKKYNAGAEQLFTFTGMPEDGLRSAVRLYLDEESTLPALYIVDPRDQAIYQVTLAGKFLFRLKSTDPAMFRGLTSVFVDNDDLYIAAGSALYYLNIGDLKQLAATNP